MREPAPLQQVDRTCVWFGKRKLAYFAGCDYFRLASHPAVLKAAQQGLKRFGLNVSASRMTTGNHALYRKLEERLAAFFRAPAALLVSNGYATNLTVAQGLRELFSHALIDERAHPSLADAAEFLGCPVLRFKHRNADEVARAVKRIGADANFILLTDGMFPFDGATAPLKAYLKVLPRSALLLVDDAHGAGTLGAAGRGAVEVEGVSRTRIIQTMTLSKAFGAYGGAILCSKAFRQRIIAQSRMFVGCTPLPLPLASAALAGIQLLGKDKRLRSRLMRNSRFVKAALKDAGIAAPENAGPIIPIVPKSRRHAAALRAALLRNGVYPSFTKYPGSPPNGCFRFVLSSEHTARQIESLLEALRMALASSTAHDPKGEGKGLGEPRRT